MNENEYSDISPKIHKIEKKVKPNTAHHRRHTKSLLQSSKNASHETSHIKIGTDDQEDHPMFQNADK